jgi:hypothetical protein
VGGRWAERPAARSSPAGVVVEAVALKVRVSRFRGSGFRGLHCPVGLEMKGVGAPEAWRRRRRGGAGAPPAGVGQDGRWAVTGDGGARCIRVREGRVEGAATGGWEGDAAAACWGWWRRRRWWRPVGEEEQETMGEPVITSSHLPEGR